MKRLVLVVLLTTIANCQEAQECLGRPYGYGTVCVCNSEHCDSIPRPEPVDSSQYLIYTSNADGLRFQKQTGNFTSESTDNEILLSRNIIYQTIIGFGGAFTDATGINIDSLDEDLQDKILESYFSEDGIEYSTCRVPIGGTDFSSHGYSYDDGDPDPDLKNFALAPEDHKYKIPLIRKATELSNNSLQLFASAWTAPKWMKTNGEYSGWGFIKNEHYQTWADYFVKFLEEYEKENITFWGITTGNEPNTVLVPLNQINVVGWNSSELGNWVFDNLGPTLRDSKFADIKIMIYDDQRLFLPSYLDIALEREGTRNYVDGIAVHWYTNNLTPAKLFTETHEHFPEKFILSTEACHVPLLTGDAVQLGSWDRGEAYSADIIEDLENWVSGWIDWNMVLDKAGGPTYIDNFVDSPIIVSPEDGEFYKQPMFYHMGHFSKFVTRNSIRFNVNFTFSSQVFAVAFERPDSSTVVVILNRSKEEMPVSLVDPERGTALLELTPKSINTIVYW